MKPPGRLPRLDKSLYQGFAMAHWTPTTLDRATGWLNEHLHLQFRELLLHSAFRQRLSCPIYCLMPDHIRLIWMGSSPSSDQITAMVFLRTHLEKRLLPARFQPQAYDHVLRENERERGAFASIVHYIAENPVRARLTADAKAWPYTGCAVPGYPALDPREEKFWNVYWKILARHAGSAEA
jgi:putative transposase